MTIMFYAVAVLLILVFVTAFLNSATKGRINKDRQTDLIVGCAVFICFIVLVVVFGGKL